MTVTLSIWILPVLVTAVIWLAAILWPTEVQNDQYGFGAALDALLRLVLAAGGTLLTWLAFFIAMWAVA